MRFHLYANVAFEKWNWVNSITQGIGGSETSQVEMARHLAKRGHEVHSYAPLPEGSPREWEGTFWHDTTEANFDEPGIWMLYRCPEKLDEFDSTRTDQVRWLCFQDWWYPTLTPERVAKLHRAVILCRAHENFLLGKCPELRGLTWITRNAIKNDLIAEVEAEGVPKRNPKRIMFTSSPDRGLAPALRIFARAKEIVPDLEMHISYGFNNIDKIIEQGGVHFLPVKNECMKLVEETGAHFLGRIPQKKLYGELLKTGMLVYISSFFETGWINGLEAQALGAIPVFSPVYAQGENTRHGVQVIGDPNDEATIAKAAVEIVRLATDPELQERIRADMMPDVRAKWGWEQFAWKKPGENWEQAAEEDLAKLAAKASEVVVPDATQPVQIEMIRGLCDNEYEAVARAYWLKLKPGSIMVDVGAADGSWSIPAAKQGATVYAFEPETTFIHGAAESAGVDSSINVVKQKVGNFPAHGVVTLDQFFFDNKIGMVDFIKIDVEGDEIGVLRGAGTLIRLHKPRIFVEVHDETVPDKSVTVDQVKAELDACRFGLSGDKPYKYKVIPLVSDGKKYHHLLAYTGELS